MNHGSLFNGIGAFQLAAYWMGWTNIMHCEIDEFCNKVVKKYFPDSIQHGDIKTTDFRVYRGGIDILTGGDPCQPHSYAGNRKGKEDERYLWPHYKRAIEEINPGWIVNENVPGTINNGVLDEKISDLESIGYSCWTPLVIPACGVGALHKRNRVWLVAYSERNIKPREESCNREVGRMGGQFQSMAWDDDWENKVAQFRRMDDGSANNLDRTDAIRNAIVPQVALEIFKAIDQYEHMAR
jgi:DNA (cytosine-5)-methyltransferase 1